MTNPDIHIVGARPNFMKAAPVVERLIARGRPPLIVHTGQHYDAEMSQVFFNELAMKEPDINLGIGSGTHAQQTAALLTALEETFQEHRPGRVVVYGDINSTIAAALVAAKIDIPVAHVEAGLRSFDRTMPEEVNRVVTDVLSDVHFVTSEEGMSNLQREGVSLGHAHFVGNPMIDTLLRFRDTLDSAGARKRHGLPERYAVATLHRPANVDDPATASGLVDALTRVSKHLPILIPLHPRGRRILVEAGLTDVQSIQVVEPLGYLEFMSLVVDAALVLTDSGGIQEETTVSGVPCLTLRDNTERPVTITMGTNVLVGNHPDRIVAAAEEFLSHPPEGTSPPLWDGRAGERIAEILVSFQD